MRHLLLAATIILCACGSSAGGGSQLAVAGSPESLTYVPELKVDLASMTKRPSGLYLKDLAVGAGAEAVQGRTVDVHYTGWLASGLEFDSSRGSDPFSFTVGGGRVIAGWDEGVVGMKVGGKRLLVLPPDLGYGAAGAGGVIPPGATLIFEVELLGVR
jgi:FKBP-type peptidyl-prolyl cis-trans isomerase FkpA